VLLLACLWAGTGERFAAHGAWPDFFGVCSARCAVLPWPCCVCLVSFRQLLVLHVPLPHCDIRTHSRIQAQHHTPPLTHTHPLPPPQVVPVTEILQSTCGRYHDLLAATVQVQLSAVVDADVLGELEVRAADTHRHLVDDYNLPWQLEGAGGGWGWGGGGGEEGVIVARPRGLRGLGVIGNDFKYAFVRGEWCFVSGENSIWCPVGQRVTSPHAGARWFTVSVLGRGGRMHHERQGGVLQAGRRLYVTQEVGVRSSTGVCCLGRRFN